MPIIVRSDFNLTSQIFNNHSFAYHYIISTIINKPCRIHFLFPPGRTFTLDVHTPPSTIDVAPTIIHLQNRRCDFKVADSEPL